MSEIIISLIFFILGAIVSWYLTYRYYMKNKIDLETMNKNLVDRITQLKTELNSIDTNNKLAINEDRIDKAIQAYRRNGTPESIINSFSDLSLNEKAAMFDTVFLRVKGRLAKNNPFRK